MLGTIPAPQPGAHTVIVKPIREAVEYQHAVIPDPPEMATGDNVLVVLDALRPAGRTARTINGLQVRRDRHQIGIEPSSKIALDK